MQPRKNAITSKGIWGGVIGLMAGIALMFGVDFSPENQDKVADGFEALMVLVGAVMAVWGRWSAKEGIKGLMLMMALVTLSGCGTNQSTPALGVQSGERFDSWQSQYVVQHTPIYFGRSASSYSGFEPGMLDDGTEAVLPAAGEATEGGAVVSDGVASHVLEAIQGGAAVIYVGSININPTNEFGTDAGREGSGAGNTGGTVGATTQEASPTTEVEATIPGL